MQDTGVNMPTFRNRIMAAYSAAVSAYRKGYFNQDIDFTDDNEWADFDARRMRYDFLWQYYNGNPYDKDVNNWARLYKSQQGLYEHTRPIENPAFELGDFYETYVWGGILDMNAGDSSESALPIVTEIEALRPHIASIFKWSNWTTRRNTIPLYGATMGDVFIQVVDNRDSNKVYIREVHPAKVAELEKDDFGNIKSYRVEYTRTDDKGTNEVTYSETAMRDGDSVLYKLYKNGSPYAWDGAESAEWEEPYGFIPMVHIQHKETPHGWGQAEIHPRLALFRELDDQKSLLNDHIRKVINAPWIVTGEDKESFEDMNFSSETSARPQPMREEALMLYLSSPDSDMKPMVTTLPIEQVSGNIDKINQKLKNSYPEIALADISTLAQVSGVTVRRMQQPAARKVDKCRAVYDGALVRVIQMALSIGGMRGIFEGITADSYMNGALDFSIGKRSVFSNDVMDDLEIAEKRSEVFKIYTDAGADAEQAALQAGHDEKTAAELADSRFIDPRMNEGSIVR